MNSHLLSISAFWRIIPLLALFSCTACAPIKKASQRSMNVTGGPDRVFENSSVETLIPELAGASATGINGRVGNELVFWGYRLADEREANLYACAPLEGVDCESRISSICPARGEEIARYSRSGLVRHLDCQAVGIVGTGDLTPNCEDQETPNDLVVGLMQCR